MPRPRATAGPASAIGSPCLFTCTITTLGNSGTVKAKGKIDEVKIQIAGSGNADFGQMQTQKAEVDISGHGDVHIAPTEQAKIEISGSGDVYLHSDPKTLDTDMHGSGRVHKVGAGG